MFKNFLVNIFKSLSDTKKQTELFWGLVGGISTIIFTHLLGKIFPNKTFSISLDIGDSSFGWSTYGEATLIGSAINFIIGFLIAYLLTFMIRKYLQEK